MNLKIGQKVVCINASFRNYCACPLKTGAIYTILGFYTCDCGSHQIYLDEISDLVWMGCKCDQILLSRQRYYSNRFRPLKYYNIYKTLLEGIKETPEKKDIEKLKLKCAKKYKTLYPELNNCSN